MANRADTSESWPKLKLFGLLYNNYLLKFKIFKTDLSNWTTNTTFNNPLSNYKLVFVWNCLIASQQTDEPSLNSGTVLYIKTELETVNDDSKMKIQFH